MSQVTSTAQNRHIQTITAYTAVNEPVLSYEDGCEEKEALLKTLEKYSSSTEDVPIVIGDEEFRTKEIKYQVEVCNLWNTKYFYNLQSFTTISKLHSSCSWH